MRTYSNKYGLLGKMGLSWFELIRLNEIKNNKNSNI